MGTIQKRADKLKPGDVWVIQASRYAILAALHDTSSGEIELTTCGICEGVDAGMRDRSSHSPTRLFDVEAPDLSPAQQHAEELLSLVREGVECAYCDPPVLQWAIAGKTLLDKIAPPAPPTLEEALQALNEVMTKRDNTEAAMSILDRARRTGLL